MHLVNLMIGIMANAIGNHGIFVNPYSPLTLGQDAALHILSFMNSIIQYVVNQILVMQKIGKE